MGFGAHTNGAATAAKQDEQTVLLTQIEDNTDELEERIGPTDESAAASDTATSGLNGLLKRIAQNITTLINKFTLGASNEDLSVSTVDILAGAGVQSALTVGATAVEVRVGASRLANRRMVSIHNNSLATIYWGFTSAVTTANGTPIPSGQFIDWRASDATSIFVIAGGGANNTRITECV